MSQEQIETLISKIWWRKSEIFDQNHDWVGALLSKEPKESHLFTFYAVPSVGLLLHWSIEFLPATQCPWDSCSPQSWRPHRRTCSSTSSAPTRWPSSSTSCRSRAHAAKPSTNAASEIPVCWKLFSCIIRNALDQNRTGLVKLPSHHGTPRGIELSINETLLT